MAIARASHNALFLQIVTSFAPLMRVAVPAAWSTRDTEAQRNTMIDLHLAVAVAIRRRDIAAAIAGMDAHFDESVGAMLRGLS